MAKGKKWVPKAKKAAAGKPAEKAGGAFDAMTAKRKKMYSNPRSAT